MANGYVGYVEVPAGTDFTPLFAGLLKTIAHRLIGVIFLRVLFASNTPLEKKRW
jgi:hypothetical protein